MTVSGTVMKVKCEKEVKYVGFCLSFKLLFVAKLQSKM